LLFDKKNRKEAKMADYLFLLIRFNGCLNGYPRTVVNLLLIKHKNINFISPSDLSAFLYRKRGKGELGPKNGPKTNGFLEVLKINHVKFLELQKECKVLLVDTCLIPEIYEQIKENLREAILEKIKIKPKEEPQRPQRKNKRKNKKKLNKRKEG